MMRGLLVVVVALGLGAAGCATDVDDPVPDPPGDVLDNEPRGFANLTGPNLVPTINRENIPKFPVPQR